MTTCTCGRETRDDAHVCDDCVHRLHVALGDCLWTDAELAVTLTGEKGVDYRGAGGAGSTEHRLPVHLAASDARAQLRLVLGQWVKFCTDHGIPHQSPTEARPADNVVSMSRWLIWRLDGLSFHPQGPDAVANIVQAVDRAKAVIDRPAPKWYAGPCDACGAGLYAVPDAATVKCRAMVKGDDTDDGRCGHVVDVAERRATLLAEAEDRLVNAADISRAVSWLGAAPLTAERVRQWASRGRLLAKGHDGSSPLYRVGDAIDLLASETARRAK